jgi:hypothetical protein
VASESSAASRSHGCMSHTRCQQFDMLRSSSCLYSFASHKYECHQCHHPRTFCLGHLYITLAAFCRTPPIKRIRKVSFLRRGKSKWTLASGSQSGRDNADASGRRQIQMAYTKVKSNGARERAHLRSTHASAQEECE